MKLRQNLLPAAIAALLVVGDGVLAGAADHQPTPLGDQPSRQERFDARGSGSIDTLNSNNVVALRSSNADRLNAR